MSEQKHISTTRHSVLRAPSYLIAMLIAAIPAIAAIYLIDILRSQSFLDPSQPIHGLLRTVLLFIAHDGEAARVWLMVLGAGVATSAMKVRAGDFALSPYLIAILGGLSAWAVGTFVFQGYGLSPDEYIPLFQAEIFRTGDVMAAIPPIAEGRSAMFLPLLGWTDDANGLWASYYRPVHALLLALTPRIADFSVLNGVMTATSVLALADICKRLWPDQPTAPLLAGLLLLASPQVLVTAGTGFAFSAHLAANLVWLALFLRGTWRAHALAAVIGALAVGLHQVHAHPLFAAPFLAAMFFGAIGRWIHLLPYAIGYGVALPVWVLWPELGGVLETGDIGLLPTRLSDIHYFRSYTSYTDAVAPLEVHINSLLLGVNLLRFALWLSPVAIILAVIALLRFRGVGLLPWLCAAGVLLTVLATHVLMPNQTQTWGARYYHPVIGNVVIFAVAGWVAARRSGLALGPPIAAMIALSALVMLPQRLIHVDERIGPRRDLQVYIEAIPADFVVVTPLDGVSVIGAVRNDPYLRNTPRILFVRDASRIPELPGRVHVLSLEDLDGIGFPQGTLLEPGLRGANIGN